MALGKERNSKRYWRRWAWSERFPSSLVLIQERLHHIRAAFLKDNWLLVLVRDALVKNGRGYRRVQMGMSVMRCRLLNSMATVDSSSPCFSVTSLCHDL